VIPQSAPAVPVAQSAASLRSILTDTQVSLAPSTTQIYSDTIVLIQTPQGVADAGKVSVSWRPQTDVVTIHRLRILRKGAQIDLLGAGQTFSVPHPEALREYATLSGLTRAVIEPGGLQVGDQLEFSYTLQRTDPLLGGIPEQIIGVSPEVAPARVHLRARWPAGYQMTWRASPFIAPVSEAHAGEFVEVSTTLNNAAPLVQPLGAPARFLLDRAMQVSGHASWPAISQRLFPLFEHAAQLAGTSPLQAQLARLRSLTADPKARAAAALRLVQDQIRYVPVEMNDAQPSPADADTTWARHYGDCRAKTVVLVALLHGLGIEAEAVAVATHAGDALPQRLPMLQWFNHVLVRASIGGRSYWLDGARLGDRQLDDLPVPNFRWGLPLRAVGAQLLKIEPGPPSVPTEDTTFWIDASAGATVPASLTIQALLRGDAAITTQSALSRLTEEQRDTALHTYWRQQSYLAKDWTNVKLFEVKATFDDASGNLRLLAQGQGNMVWQDGRHPLGSLAIGRVVDLKREPGPHSDAPYLVAYPTYAHVTEHIKLPNAGAGFEAVGADVDRIIAGMRYLRSARIKDGELIGDASARSVQPEFPAAEAQSAQVALRALSDQSVYVKQPAAQTAAAVSR
jgi:transglutaminase-like putative cysteine protease